MVSLKLLMQLDNPVRTPFPQNIKDNQTMQNHRVSTELGWYMKIKDTRSQARIDPLLWHEYRFRLLRRVLVLEEPSKKSANQYSYPLTAFLLPETVFAVTHLLTK